MDLRNQLKSSSAVFSVRWSTSNSITALFPLQKRAPSLESEGDVVIVVVVGVVGDDVAFVLLLLIP